jgi:hypothetical protein
VTTFDVVNNLFHDERGACYAGAEAMRFKVRGLLVPVGDHFARRYASTGDRVLGFTALLAGWKRGKHGNELRMHV